MRKTANYNDLKIQAIAGTYVVMLGFNLPKEKCKGLSGFSIHRTDHTENEAYYLRGTKVFKETDPGFSSGKLYSSRDHPIQSFQWADYSAKPGHKYTYKVTALKGKPKDLKPFLETSVKIETENPQIETQDIYFNRGIAASQEYARRFGNRPPNLVPNNEAFEWLSRGLYEALEEFVKSCIPGKHSLRIAAYEFNYERFLKLLKDISKSGVDIKIIYDARKNPPSKKNKANAIKFGLKNLCTERTTPKSYIAHNKFIVKLENRKAISVWTGGTNFSEGGIFGHSNVAHVIENAEVADSYLQYWKELKKKQDVNKLKNNIEQLTPTPQKLLKEISLIFSPRKNLNALKFYAELAKKAKDALFMTFAFGINDIFKDVYANSNAPLRYALLEKMTRAMKKGPVLNKEVKAIKTLRKMPENVFAIGDFIRTNNLDGWLLEKLTGLNKNVKYVHNKFMLVDPLSKDPILIAGSANFSEASTTKNDENMVIIKGNTKVADIYLGEFMRLFTHHSFRESLKWRQPNQQPKYLDTNDWWKAYFGNTPRSTRRKYFASVDQ